LNEINYFSPIEIEQTDGKLNLLIFLQNLRFWNISPDFHSYWLIMTEESQSYSFSQTDIMATDTFTRKDTTGFLLLKLNSQL